MSRQEYFDNDKYERSAKLFITNLPPNMPEDHLKSDLQPLFQKFGTIKSINVKKHKSGQYSYSFLQFQRIEDAIKAIQEMDQKIVHERPMKVRQDRQGDGCFHCKKTGHFAKQCPYRQSGGRQDRRRSSRDRYENDRYRRREKQRSRSKSDHYERERHQRRHRRSRQREYSPYEYQRGRDHRRQRQRQRERQRQRQRHRHSNSRSRSGSYQEPRYRRRNEYERDERRESREYRRPSRSSSYDRRGR